MDPFVFMTSVQAVQLTGLRASSLSELHAGLTQVDGSSVYHHTHRFYRSHSHLSDTSFSDFAFWAGQNLKEEAVAERLATLDLRDYSTLRDLRQAILDVLESSRNQANHWDRRVPPGLEFHFCRSTSLLLPTGYQASNLEEFLHALERIDTSCLYYHLIEAPLHLEADRPYRNDFSEWLSRLPGLREKADAIAGLDPYRWDLEELRKRLLALFRPGRLKSAVERLLEREDPSPSGGVVASWVRRWRKGD